MILPPEAFDEQPQQHSEASDSEAYIEYDPEAAQPVAANLAVSEPVVERNVERDDI